MRVDEWGYTKVNGIRVNAESYHRKVRKLERQNGRRSAIRTSLHGAPSAKCQSHAATLTLFSAEGRQVYPTLRWVSDCGVDVYDAQRIYGPSTCKRCRGVKDER